MLFSVKPGKKRNKYQIEFYETDFPGMFESVEDGENEKVKIEVSKGMFEEFIVKHCKKKGDGKTIIATLSLL